MRVNFGTAIANIAPQKKVGFEFDINPQVETILNHTASAFTASAASGEVEFPPETVYPANLKPL